VVINTLKPRAARPANPDACDIERGRGHFVVGGEYGFRRLSGGMALSPQTDYREYGVRLNFKPDLQDNGVISPHPPRGFRHRRQR
jgi:pilus assembly protein CpaC